MEEVGRGERGANALKGQGKPKKGTRSTQALHCPLWAPGKVQASDFFSSFHPKVVGGPGQGGRGSYINTGNGMEQCAAAASQAEA